MKTFNDKPPWKNILAVILAVIGIAFLTATWVYHWVVHFITMPQERWESPFDKELWIIKESYPNRFCKWFCNIESTMIYQLGILREGFGREYCKEGEI